MVINETRKGSSKDKTDSNLVSILTSEELYQGDDQTIINELMMFYAAGVDTLQVSQTNFIYYITKHKEAREKFLAEVRPVV